MKFQESYAESNLKPTILQIQNNYIWGILKLHLSQNDDVALMKHYP